MGVILHFRILVVSILPTSHPHPLLRSRQEFSILVFFLLIFAVLYSSLSLEILQVYNTPCHATSQGNTRANVLYGGKKIRTDSGVSRKMF